MIDTLSGLYAIKAAALFGAIAAIAAARLRPYHPFARFGPANQVTTVRALLVSLVAAFVGEPHVPGVAAAAATVGSAATALDGVDGWLARRTRMMSAFGARFDLEVDALLILALSVLVWTHDKAGAWILGAGLLRYAFVAAGWIWPWLNQPLFPSVRRKTICVVQIAGLIVALLPVVRAPLSTLIAAASLAALAYSFFVDCVWLWRRRKRHCPTHPTHLTDPTHLTHPPVLTHPTYPTHSTNVWRNAALLAAAVLVLDAALTFENIWPTPAVRWTGGLSVELAVCVLALSAVGRAGQVGRVGRVGQVGRVEQVGQVGQVGRVGQVGQVGRVGLTVLRNRLTALLAGVWVLLAIGRYAEVTAPALYGRDINLYWDLRFIPDVVAMVTRVAPMPLVIAILACVVVALLVLFAVFRWAFERIISSLGDERVRRAMSVAAVAVLVLFSARQLGANLPDLVPGPVVRTYARQLGLVLAARNGNRSLPPSPDIESSLTRIEGADVFLVFVESYGALAYDAPIAERLASSRSRLEADIHDTGRAVTSAFVESPTFGGSSWLAHLSFLTGIEVRDPDTNALLMTQRRPTLVQMFARHGYRTIGLMPGMRQQWPEGAFYGFDEIYSASKLAYAGPEFGWFALPDQFSLARLDDLEAARPPARCFVFFPTISTHFPFSPTPPYQPEWSRMLTPRPYDGPAIVRAYSRQPDWVNFRPGYVDAVSYDLSVLGGYLRKHADRDVVMIMIGDHQPPAAVSGEHASWDVPVHVIASRPPLLDYLAGRGFRAGLTPGKPAVARMHTLLPMLLDAFGDHE